SVIVGRQHGTFLVQNVQDRIETGLQCGAESPGLDFETDGFAFRSLKSEMIHVARPANAAINTARKADRGRFLKSVVRFLFQYLRKGRDNESGRICLESGHIQLPLLEPGANREMNSDSWLFRSGRANGLHV